MTDLTALLDDGDIGWVAGIVEGEGCFMWHYRRASVGNPSPRFQLQMNDRDVVDRFAELVGQGNAVCRQSRRSPQRHDLHRLTLDGAKCVDLMVLVRPWMGERRRKKIDALLTKMGLTRKTTIPANSAPEVPE